MLDKIARATLYLYTFYGLTIKRMSFDILVYIQFRQSEYLSGKCKLRDRERETQIPSTRVCVYGVRGEGDICHEYVCMAGRINQTLKCNSYEFKFLYWKSSVNERWQYKRYNADSLKRTCTENKDHSTVTS